VQPYRIIIDAAVGVQAYLVEELFFSCTNERLFKISRQDDPPFYTASVRKPGSKPLPKTSHGRAASLA